MYMYYLIRYLNTDILGMGLNFYKNHMCLINQAELATMYTGWVMLLVMCFNLFFSVKLFCFCIDFM